MRRASYQFRRRSSYSCRQRIHSKMSHASTSGFLIVLVDSTEYCDRNSRYTGVDRLPPYAPPPYSTHFPEETTAIEDYVFGAYKDADPSLIIDYSKAIELWQRFKVSRRPYEILLCCSGPDDQSITEVKQRGASIAPLGYDVANIRGDCWSIVGDYSVGEWAKLHVEGLNNNGLFNTRGDAEQYLKGYVDHQEADWDTPFEVVFVARIVPAEDAD